MQSTTACIKGSQLHTNGNFVYCFSTMPDTENEKKHEKEEEE